MEKTTLVTVHESAAPEGARRRVLAALRRAEMDASLLYGGPRQTSLWMELHQAVSPAQQDPAVAALYEEAFARAAQGRCGNVLHVVSLACGSGSKDVRGLRLARSAERAVLYTPADISLEMVLTAQRAATQALPGLQCTPLVCELTQCSVMPALLKSFDPSGAERLILLLGAIHNCWPAEFLKSTLYPLRAQDQLLVSANLAPAEDYDGALARILPQYDNAPTRAWLFGALSELGLSPEDGQLRFSLPAAEGLPSLKRIEARFEFDRAREIRFFGETFSFEKGSTLGVFYSHRFTPSHVRTFLQQAGLQIAGEWLLPEEGLFLCRRAGA